MKYGHEYYYYKVIDLNADRGEIVIILYESHNIIVLHTGTRKVATNTATRVGVAHGLGSNRGTYFFFIFFSLVRVHTKIS